MLITRETDYALRVLRGLVSGRLMTVREICDAEAIPLQFAYKILKKLELSGLVFITRGSKGGCRLIAELRAITLYDLMDIMGEDRQINACIDLSYECSWRQTHQTPCNYHSRLVDIQQVLDTELRRYSLHKVLFGDY